MLTIKRLSLSDAKVMLEGAERKAKEIGVPMCIAVVDDSGTLIALSRMDGAKVTAVHLATDKAFTAAAAKRATHIYNELCVPGKPIRIDMDEQAIPPVEIAHVETRTRHGFGYTETAGDTLDEGRLARTEVSR